MSESICPGPQCTRIIQVRGMCKAHYAQFCRRSGRLSVLGDREHQRERQRQYWVSMSPEERDKKMTPFKKSNVGRVRNEQWLQRMSEGQRKRWTDGSAVPSGDHRVCKGCGDTFERTGFRQIYCTIACQQVAYRIGRFGITPQQYNDMIKRQSNKCALCGLDWHGYSTKPKMPHIDHCHKTGKVRGLLCGDCNTALGRFGDDPVRLRAAAAYLEGAAKNEEAAA